MKRQLLWGRMLEKSCSNDIYSNNICLNNVCLIDFCSKIIWIWLHKRFNRKCLFEQILFNRTSISQTLFEQKLFHPLLGFDVRQFLPTYRLHSRHIFNGHQKFRFRISRLDKQGLRFATSLHNRASHYHSNYKVWIKLEWIELRFCWQCFCSNNWIWIQNHSS
jgi:hypothetical protein